MNDLRSPGCFHKLELDSLALPPERFNFAQMFLVFGSLQVKFQSSGDTIRIFNVGTTPNAATGVSQKRF